MVSVEQANETVAKMRELETEQNLMKDLFNRALRMSQSSGEGKLNFRHAERHMPGMFNGKATEYTEYMFKMEAYMSTLDPAGKGGEILRAAATEVKDMDDAEVANLAAIYWNVSALDSALASSLITTTTGEVGTLVRRVLQAFPGSGLRAWQELNRWYRPKSAVEGAASMAGIIAPSRAKSIAELQRFIMDWELRVAEHEARHNECVQDSVKVAALKRMMTAKMAERYIEGPNTYPELRSRFAAYVGEKMIQQSHVPMDIGEVEGEIEGSDDQIDELRGARKPRRDERSTHQRGPGKQPWRASPLGRHEKREADNGHDSVKNQKRKKRALVCYNCGGKGHPARLCPTPSDHAAHAVDEEGDTEEESSDEGDVCGVEWECELDGTGDEDDDILGMGCESAEQSKWERLAAVVDSGAAEDVLPAGVCNHVKLSATRRSDAGIGFRGAGGERIRNHGQRKFKVRMRDGHVAGTTWQVADVKRPLMSVAKMVAAGNRVHLDSKDPRIVRPKGEAGNVFVVDLWVRKDATSRRPGFHRQA